jgi:hypothetical protein
MIRRAAMTPRLTSPALKISIQVGTTRIATYPYTATSSPTVRSPRTVSRVASQVTTARKIVGRPSPSAVIQLSAPHTR